jgi:hypothetical protein
MVPVKDAQESPCRQMLIKTSMDGLKEWTMMELQGILEARDVTISVDSLPLGDLAKKGEKGVTLTIGNQRMDGKLVDLKQPFTIMKRKETEAISNQKGESNIVAEFEIAGIIRRKLVFLHRCSLKIPPQ